MPDRRASALVRRRETHRSIPTGVFELDEGNAARRDPDRPALGVGEPAQATFSDGTLHLLLESLGVVDLQLDEFVGRAYANANLHAPIVTPFPTMSEGRTFGLMGRALVIVSLVGVFMASGVAGAAPAHEIRLPVTTQGARGVSTVTVVEGDHLWKISERHLRAESPETAVAPYWRTVIEVNTPNLRSGDPDLIYPGELIEMPPISERP